MKRRQFCTQCGRDNGGAFLCAVCATEIRHLLVGAPRDERRGQPGLVWYIGRLRETAYRMDRLGGDGSGASSDGYDLLARNRAVDVLGRIDRTLTAWDATLSRLQARQKVVGEYMALDGRSSDTEIISVRRARNLAAHLKLLRTACDQVNVLYVDLTSLTRAAHAVINRPADLLCGPCPTIVDGGLCGTLLYALEGQQSIRCRACGTSHDVERLRANMRIALSDMLFSRSELIKIMNNHLGDKINHSSFGLLLRDRRLAPRSQRTEVDAKGDPHMVDLFTYDDLCEAREKPVPTSRVKRLN